ncbi:MAG: amidohydrolase family protein [Candidatus Hadarchaeales archaeon]
MIVDFHAEIITKRYFKRMLRSRGVPRIETVKGGYRIFYGDNLAYHFDNRMLEMDIREREMEQSGVDIQVIGLAMPGVDMLKKREAIDASKESNDDLCEVVGKSSKFLGLATVPMKYPEIAVREIERCVDELGLSGLKIPSNVDGVPLDWEGFHQIYEAAEEMGVPVMIHPAKPVMADFTMEYGLTNVVGFLFDTTLAALRLVFGGVMEKFRKLKVILPHAGSTIPYIISRIDHQHGINVDCREHIRRPPSSYIKKIYIDTAQAFHAPAFMCARELMTSDRIIFGTDYPFASIEKSVEFIRSLDIPEDEKSKILYKNAEVILKVLREK